MAKGTHLREEIRSLLRASSHSPALINCSESQLRIICTIFLNVTQKIPSWASGSEAKEAITSKLHRQGNKSRMTTHRIQALEILGFK